MSDDRENQIRGKHAIGAGASSARGAAGSRGSRAGSSNAASPATGGSGAGTLRSSGSVSASRGAGANRAAGSSTSTGRSGSTSRTNGGSHTAPAQHASSINRATASRNRYAGDRAQSGLAGSAAGRGRASSGSHAARGGNASASHAVVGAPGVNGTANRGAVRGSHQTPASSAAASNSSYGSRGSAGYVSPNTPNVSNAPNISANAGARPGSRSVAPGATYASGAYDQAGDTSGYRVPLGYANRAQAEGFDQTAGFAQCMSAGQPAGDAQFADDAASAQYQDLQRGFYVSKHKKKRMPVWKRVLIIVLSVLLVLLLAAGGYALWFSSQLNSRMALDSETSQNMKGVLSESSIDKPFYMLLLGSDSREGNSDEEQYADGSERSDVMILVRIDSANKKVTLLSIPRDTPYTYEDGTLGKINETYNKGGAAYTVKAVSEVTGVNISHYAEVRISQLETIVDYLGGVDVYVNKKMSVKDTITGEKITLEEGQQTLNGQQAQAFARSRKNYGTNQDGNRQSNVRQLCEAILKKALSKPVNQLPDVILNLAGCVGTDLSSTDLISLATAFAGGSGSLTMYSGTGPTEGDNYGTDGTWLCYQNPEGWKKIISVVDAGEDPSDVDVSSTSVIPDTTSNGQ